MWIAFLLRQAFVEKFPLSESTSDCNLSTLLFPQFHIFLFAFGTASTYCLIGANQKTDLQEEITTKENNATEKSTDANAYRIQFFMH